MEQSNTQSRRCRASLPANDEPDPSPGGGISAARRRGEGGGGKREVGGSWAGRYFGMDAARNWAEGEETDETIREDMGGEATVGTGPRRAGRDYHAALRR